GIEAGSVRSMMMLVTPITVRDGARLEGTGSIGATTVHDGGTLAPGGPISTGVMTVTGDLALLPGSQLELRATPGGKADSIRVVGKAALDGHLTALAQAGDWQPSTEYEVV